MYGTPIGGYFKDRGDEALQSNREIQEYLNRSLSLRNMSVKNDAKDDDADTFSVSGIAKREALNDKIQEMLDKGESLKSVSFDDFQKFCYDRYNMPISKEIYNDLYKASSSREDFDGLLRELLEKWKDSGNGNLIKNWANDTANDTLSYATYARNARVTLR
ncbi:MAG: hypothetical protein FWG09_04060 [Synergistaceae bacterium]|nr:hypothetical protein [Synergistaceae bacterium]